MAHDIDLEYWDAATAVRGKKLLASVQAADSTCSVIGWLMGVRHERFHLVLGRDLAGRPIGFAAADARDGHVRVHEISVVDTARESWPELPGVLLDSVIESCQSAWGDVLVPIGRDDLQEHLEERGWKMIGIDVGGVWMSGEHAA